VVGGPTSGITLSCDSISVSRVKRSTEILFSGKEFNASSLIITSECRKH
jgi:hypothetical protein